MRKNETFVINGTFENGEDGTITLDLRAGVNVWPKHVEVPGKNIPKKQGLKMCAANGTEIANFGRKVIRSPASPLTLRWVSAGGRGLSELEPASFRCR